MRYKLDPQYRNNGSWLGIRDSVLRELFGPDFMSVEFANNQYPVTKIREAGYMVADIHLVKAEPEYRVGLEEVLKQIQEKESQLMREESLPEFKSIGCNCAMCRVSTPSMLPQIDELAMRLMTSSPLIKKEKKMPTIRERIRYATLSKDEKTLREAGILSENGNLTEAGRRVLCDVLFENKDVRNQIVELVEKTIDKE